MVVATLEITEQVHQLQHPQHPHLPTPIKNYAHFVKGQENAGIAMGKGMILEWVLEVERAIAQSAPIITVFAHCARAQVNNNM